MKIIIFQLLRSQNSSIVLLCYNSYWNEAQAWVKSKLGSIYH